MNILRKAALVPVLGCLVLAARPVSAQAAPLGQQEQRVQLLIADGLTQEAANLYNSTLTQAGYQCAVVPSSSGTGFAVIAYFESMAQRDQARRGFLAAGYKLPPEAASSANGLSTEKANLEAEALAKLGLTNSTPPPATGAAGEAEAFQHMKQREAESEQQAAKQQQKDNERWQATVAQDEADAAQREQASQHESVQERLGINLNQQLTQLANGGDKSIQNALNQNLNNINSIANRDAQLRAQREAPQSNASGIHPSSGAPAPPPTYPSTGAVKPADCVAVNVDKPCIPLAQWQQTQQTASSGNSNICPADGWIMVQTGDVAVGHQCTPGQPVGGSSSGSGGSGASNGSGSATGGSGSADASGGSASGSGSNSKLVSPRCTGVMGKLVQDTNLPNRNDLWFNSLCAEDVSVTWYLGNALGATASIHSFANVPTYSGVYPGESTKLSIYVCPLDHPVPVKTDGNQVDGHDEKFLCSTRLGGGWPPFLPQ